MTKIVMAALILALVGFLGFSSIDGTFGEKLINGIDWLNTMHWIDLSILSVLALIIVGSLTIAGSDHGKGIAFLGAAGGTLISVFIVGFSAAKVWLTYDLMEQIDPSITSFSDIKDFTVFYIYGIVAAISSLIVTTNNSKD